MARISISWKFTIFCLLIMVIFFPSTASAEYKSNNTYMDVSFGETSSNLWNFMYAPGTWGDACYLEHFGVYTGDWNTTRASDGYEFVVDQRFEDSQNGRTASLHSENLSVTREVYLPPGDAKYFNISYTLKNTDSTQTLKDVRFFEVVDFDIVTSGDSYGWYTGSTDTVWQNNDQYFRNGFGGDKPSTGHGMGYYSFETSSDWTDGALNGLNKYPDEGAADVAVGMQWNLSDLGPGRSWQINITFYFGGSAGIYVDAGPHQTMGLGRPVRLDASRSTSVGTITSYEWDLNGDGIYEVNVSSPVYEFPGWTEPGKHNVTLRATDNAGRNATAITVITVASGSLVGLNDTFRVSLSPESAATSPGGQASFTIDLSNDQAAPDSLDLNLTGVEKGWISLPESVDLAAGESSQIPLRVSVPEDAPDGNHTLRLRAFSRNLGGSKDTRASLNVTSAPMLSDLLPEDNARTGSEEVLVSWKTPVNASSEVFVRSEAAADFRRIAGAPGEEHALNIGGLSRNSLYEYYVRSETPRGASQSDVRRIFIDNGISFDRKAYNFSIERDYNQSVFIDVKNTDTKPHELLMQVSGVPQDLALNFVGEGSVDQRIALLPGEARSIELVFHAQDALSKDYSILINLTNLDAEPITDSAVVNLKVHFPVIDYSIEEVKSDPYTLAKSLRITNRGDPLSDLSVSASRDLADLIVFSPSVDHAYLGTGQSLELVAEPVLYEGFTGAEGAITASAAGASRNLSVQFAVPPGKSISVGLQPNMSIKFAQDYDEDGMPNTNPLDEAVNSYLFNSAGSSQLGFIAKIKVNVAQNGQPAYNARTVLRLTNDSSSTTSNSTTDQWGNALFAISGPIGEYSYMASIDGYEASTETRRFSVRQNSSQTIEPQSIIWMSASDANGTIDLSNSDSGNISLGAPPFVIRASKAGLADDATPLLYLDDWAGYCDIEVIGEASGDEITFDLGYVDPGNYTAYIATQSSEGLATSSARTTSFRAEDADVLFQNNYTYEMPYPINASSVGKLTVENSQIASDPHKAARLLCVLPDENKSNYIFTYAIVSDRNLTDTLKIEAKDKKGRTFFQESLPVNLSRLSPLFVDVSVPAYYEDGTRVESLDVSVKMEDPLFLLAVLAIGLAGSAAYIEYNDPGALRDGEAWNIFLKEGVLTPHTKTGVVVKCFASFVPGANGLVGWFDLINNMWYWNEKNNQNIGLGATDLVIDPILDVTKGGATRTGIKEWQFWKVRGNLNQITHSQTVQVRLYEYFKDIDPGLAGARPGLNVQPGLGRQWQIFKEEYTKPLREGKLSAGLTYLSWGLNAFSNIDDMIRVLDEQDKEAKAGLKQTQSISVKSCINHAPLKNKFETPGYIPRQSPGTGRSPSSRDPARLVVASVQPTDPAASGASQSSSNSNIEGAYVRLFFAREPPASYQPFNTSVRLNGHVIGYINNTVPRGNYVFRADPAWLNYVERGAAVNTVTLDVDGMNRGYYVPLDGYKIDILFKSMRRAVCASSQEEADSAVLNLSGAMLRQADLTITSHDIKINPQSPVQGENATIEATVRNLGSMGALDVEVQFRDNDRLIYSQPILYLAEYSQENVSFTWQAEAGAHNIKVVVNPLHEINESDYDNNEATESFSVTGPDLSKPTISNLQPHEGSSTTYNMTMISADLADEGSGVNISSVSISVDEMDVTDKSTVTASRVWYTPIEALSYESHIAQVTVEDNYGNKEAKSWSFKISSDSEPPEIMDLRPQNGSTISEIRPLIGASLKDEDSGVDATSVALTVDGSNVTENASVFPNKIWYTIQRPLAAGRHSVSMKVKDLQGNAAERTWSFLLEEQRPYVAGHITVCTEGCDYTSIQKAVNTASPGAFIEVRAGTYRETVNVTKPLTLHGISLPAVDAGSKSSAITLSSDGIVLQGFRAENASLAGIYVHSNNNLVKDNEVEDNKQYGIYLCSARNNTLENNKAIRNGFGFYLGCISLNNTLSGNTATYNSYGIFIDLRSSGNILYLNKLHQNTDHNAYDNNIDPTNINKWNYSSVGNYYGDSDCVDSNGNGICDRENAIPGGGSVDWYPLRSPNVSMEKPPKLPEIIDKPPEIIRLTPNETSPQVAGTVVVWTAEAIDPEKDQILYRFFLSVPSTGNVSKPETGWTADNTWTWNTSEADIGENQVEVWVRDGKHAKEDSFDDRKPDSFIISAPTLAPAPMPVAPVNETPAISSLAPNKSSPQGAGKTITWTSKANDPDNDPIQYRFFLDNQPETNWSSNPSWIWTTSTADIGSHSIDVRVRDGKHDPEGDDSKRSQFTIIALLNKPPIVNGLTPDKQSPQVAGTTITWTANATDPDGDDILYKFILDNETILRSTHDNMTVPLWSNNPIWTWTTSQFETGTHHVMVEVRDGKHASPGGFDDRKEVKFDLNSPIPAGPVTPGGKPSTSTVSIVSPNGLIKPTEPYTREIKGRLNYVGGNAVRAGVDVRLQEIFEGNIYDIGSAVSSRQDGSFSITYSSDRLHNPDKPYLVIQAFRGASPFSDPVKIENIEGANSWVEITCSPH